MNKIIIVVALLAAIIGSYIVVNNPEAAAKSTGKTSAAQKIAMTQAQPALEQTSQPKSKFVQFNVGKRNVKSIYNDGDLMWVGTSGGLVRYDIKTDQYRHFDYRNGLLANGVFHVSRIDDNRIAAGTYGGGLAVFNEKEDKWTIYNVPNGLGDAFVYDLVTTKDGDVWIATWTGVNRIKGGRLDDESAWELFTVENTNGGVPNDWIYGLSEGENGEMWLATEGGLARFKDNKWQNWSHKEGLGVTYDVVKDFSPFKNDPANFSRHHAQQKLEQGLTGINTAYNPNYIISMDVDAEGSVWVGTWGAGLNKFDGEKWTHWTHKDGLPSNHITMLKIADDGVLWVGTSHGLAKMNKERTSFTNYTKEDGLFGDAVFSMDIQEQGTLWIGSFGGVSRVTNFDH